MLRACKILLEPGVRLMRRLRLPFKVGLIGLMLFVPMVVLLAGLLKAGLADRQFTMAEHAGSQVVRALLVTTAELQRVRGLNHRALNGDQGAVAPRDAARSRLQEHLRRVDGLLAGTRAFTLEDRWPSVRDAIGALAEGRHDPKRLEAFRQHTEQVEALRQLVLAAAERSGLLLDPVAQTYFLMDMSVERVLPWTETLGLVRGEGAGLLARGDASSAERARVLGRIDQLDRQLADVQWRAGALERSGTPRSEAQGRALALSRDFADRARTVFSAEALEGEAQVYFDQGTQAIDAVLAYGDEVQDRLGDALVARVQQKTQALWLQGAVSLAGVLLLAYFATAFYVSFLGAVRRLSRGMDAVADGDLAHRFDIHGRDEMAEIGGIVERMAERLSRMVAEIRSSAVRVSDTGEQLANGSAALAERTEEQAASLRQFVGTVGHLSTAVAGNAAEVSELDGVTSEVHARADQGNEAMQATVHALDALKASSARMDEIIGTIDGIAFQTNILALNAAVEAARAGEAGRGFAVVAAEVRSLAQRSSTAAGEIRQLIARSRGEVDTTVARVRHTETALTAVVGGVARVAEKLRQVAHSSHEQSQGLREMASTVGNLDEITRQNAAMVDESRASSAALVERAARLAEAVSTIRLRQGSADEARALVARAQALLRERGQAAAAEALHSVEQGFVDRDLYIFFVDREGRYRLHGAKPEMEGRRVHDVPGIDGDRFVRDAFAAAGAGGGWIDYTIVHPSTGQVLPKASWVEPLGDGLVIGCGIYREADAQPARATVAATRPARPMAPAGAAGRVRSMPAPARA